MSSCRATNANGDGTLCLPWSSLESDVATRRARERALRAYQVGALARMIWESLPDAERWWLYGGRNPNRVRRWA